MDAVAFLKRHRRAWLVLAVLAFALLIAAILILSFGWFYLRHPLERRLSRQFGRPVTIGALHRIDHSLFSPVLRVGNVHIAQPGWVGGGDMVIVRQAVIRLPLLPLLIGQARIRSIDVDGLSIALVRRDAVHANWKGIPAGSAGGTLQHFGIRNGVLTLDDRKRDHHFTATIAAGDRGLRIIGAGSLAGHPSRLALAGAAIVGGAWPFRFDYRSAIANGILIGRADHPLDIGHFSARATAWSDDLQHLDLLVEAGLPGTQPAQLTADLRHDRPDWTIRNLALHLGRSHFSGDLSIKKRADRTRVDGTILSSGLDFDDLSSKEGRARAAAKRRQFGPRIIPDTAIHLEHLQHTDAAVRLDIRHFISDAPSILHTLRGTVTLDHGVLTADPLTLVLAQGNAVGSVQVRHQSGTPTFAVDMRVYSARLEDMVGDTASGALDAHIRLRGQGRTVRAAIGNASGAIGVVGRDGAVNRRAALFLGSDAGRALFENKSDKTILRCLIARFDARNGIAVAAPLLVDTDVSRAEGKGRIDLSTEQLDLTLQGRPKLDRAVKLSLPIAIAGTMSQPQIVPQSTPKTIDTVFKLIGNAIGGKHADPAPDADCAALGAQALR